MRKFYPPFLSNVFPVNVSPFIFHSGSPQLIMLGVARWAQNKNKGKQKDPGCPVKFTFHINNGLAFQYKYIIKWDIWKTHLLFIWNSILTGHLIFYTVILPKSRSHFSFWNSWILKQHDFSCLWMWMGDEIMQSNHSKQFGK